MQPQQGVVLDKFNLSFPFIYRLSFQAGLFQSTLLPFYSWHTSEGRGDNYFFQNVRPLGGGVGV